MKIRIGSTVALTAAASFLAACASPAEQQAMKGLSAFQACDLRSASQYFDNAHSLDPARADFALAYALSTLAVLAEDPSVTAVLGRLGFDGPIDTSAFWGKGGVLDQLSAHTATCQSISDFVRSKLPYRAAQTNGPSAASIVRDPALSGNDFVTAAQALAPRLDRLVHALEQGATSDGEFDINGGCGVGSVHVEAPELYGLAAALELLVATDDAAAGYDWGLPATLVLQTSGHEQAYVDALNAHLLHLKSASSIAGAKAEALYAVQLFEKGLAAAQAIKSRPANSLFDWPAVPANVLADLSTLAVAARTTLSTPGVQPLPFFTPALSMDGSSFFTSPLDLTGASPPIWSATTTPNGAGGTYVNVSSALPALDAEVAPRFSPDPFATGAPSYSLDLSNRWNGVTSATWTGAFDPDKRWEAAYGCNN
jgi:hypothetical protein